MANEVAGLDWSGDRLVPAFQTIQHLDVYDIRGASHEAQLTIATLTGLINRPQPQVYLLSGNDDAFWLSQALGGIPLSSQQSMAEPAPQSGDEALDALITFHRHDIQGLVIYDPHLADTINIATMLAGQREGIVVSPDQVQDLQARYDLPILTDLRVYQWHNRLQAYHWAQQHLLSNSSARLVAGLDPIVTTGLRSFLVATRTFIYWLDSRNYLPEQGEGWLSERHLMQDILNSFSPGTAHLGWFIDEGSGVSLTSEAALPVLASDYFLNLEVWTSLQPLLPVTPALSSLGASSPEVTPAANSVYVSFTLSDGDNLQYCQHRLAQLWRDGARGSLPIGWTCSPILLQAAPVLADYYLRTRTANDELIAGPSGVGYMFPSRWPSEQFSPFLQRTGKLMQAMGMTTLEVLDTDLLHSAGLPLLSVISLTGMTFGNRGRQQRFVEALAPFGLQGILSGSGVWAVSWGKVDGMPVYHNLGLAGSVKSALTLIRTISTFYIQRPLFLNVYVLAWTMTPTDLQQVVQQLGPDYKIVLPGTLLALLSRSL
ncbi:MAG TPA: GxGYxYP domain-containing protein [Ktedonosporobacter sp.]|nr:GxGYxYP domain-containing protein [Ktedonosporobacter sp.]